MSTVSTKCNRPRADDVGVVAAATGEQIDQETLGGADAQVANGVAHLAVDTDAEAFAVTARFLSYRPRSADKPPPPGPTGDLAGQAVPELNDLVPVATRQA